MLYKRASLAGLFGLLMCFASWLRPDSFIFDLSMLAVLLGVFVSGNAHAPSETATYLAMWSQWTLVAYAAMAVFFPRRVSGAP